MRSRWGFKHLLLCGFLFVFFAGVSFAQTGTNDKLFIDSIKKAASLAQKGQYQESLNLLEESLIFAKKNFGPDHENVAVSLINIGLIYKEMAEYDKAEKAYKEAISILKAKSGIGQNYLLTAYAKLGDVYAIQGKYDESQRYMELSLASSAGQKSVKLLPLMITQANKYLEYKRYKEAAAYYKFATMLLEKEKAGKDTNKDSLDIILGLSKVYLGMGQHDEAEKYALKSLEMAEKTQPYEMYYAPTYENLFNIYLAKENYPEAGKYFGKYLRANGKDDSNVMLALITKAGMLFKLKQYQTAESYYKCVFHLVKEMPAKKEEKEKAMLAPIYGLIRIYGIQGRYDESEPLLKELITISERVNGTDSYETAMFYEFAGTVYVEMEKYSEAEEFFKKRISVSKASPLDDCSKIVNDLEKIIKIFRENKQYAHRIEPVQKLIANIEEYASKMEISDEDAIRNISNAYLDVLTTPITSPSGAASAGLRMLKYVDMETAESDASKSLTELFEKQNKRKMTAEEIEAQQSVYVGGKIMGYQVGQAMTNIPLNRGDFEIKKISLTNNSEKATVKIENNKYKKASLTLKLHKKNAKWLLSEI